jgi:hypothetical protein
VLSWHLWLNAPSGVGFGRGRNALGLGITLPSLALRSITPRDQLFGSYLILLALPNDSHSNLLTYPARDNRRGELVCSRLVKRVPQPKRPRTVRNVQSIAV